MAFRTDIGSLRPARRLDNGQMQVDALLTRSGVFLYRNPDGSARREYRPDNEVFAAASLTSFELIPATDDHPPAMLTAETARAYTRGALANVRRDTETPDHMAGSIGVFDAALVRKMTAGKLDVSLGYECDLEETPGVSPSGEKYDAVQRNIRGNHVAIVDRGRAGSARVRMDGASTMVDPSTDTRQDSFTMDLTQAIEALGAEKARTDALTKERDAALAALAKTEGERDAARADVAATATKAAADVAAADKARTDAADKFNGAVAARVDVERKAHAVLGLDGDKPRSFGGQTDRAIKIAVVKKVDSFDCTDTHADAYVDARFDSAVERVTKGAHALDAAREALGTGPGRADAGDAEAIAAKKMTEQAGNAWKGSK